MELNNNNLNLKKLDIIYLEYLIKILSKFINKIWVYKKDITISIKIDKKSKKNDFLNLFNCLKNHFFFLF